ncbi:hypothetical protein LIER_05408 [Lithospermum erythrorhizon]|uniref:Secreted protein n=1 Tax=Lithospermum erythrorhizon TaxID=34254 RepID=A0AAV3P1S6_LITER
MASMASLVNLGSVCPCACGCYDGSFLLVQRASFSRNVQSISRVWVGKRRRYPYVDILSPLIVLLTKHFFIP